MNRLTSYDTSLSKATPRCKSLWASNTPAGGAYHRDDAESVKWFRKAAEQGHVVAQYNLGVMYDFGEGVPEDDAEAYAWLNIAAAQGNMRAKEAREAITSSYSTSYTGMISCLPVSCWP